MKNDAKKQPIRIVMLDSAGKPIAGKDYTWETWEHGAAGFRVKGRLTSLRWADKGKTWLPAEEVK